MNSFLKWIKSFFDEGRGDLAKESASGLIVSPMQIIEEAIAVCKDKAMLYVNGRDLPNTFVVYVSKEDWDSYYCRKDKKKRTEKDLASSLLEYAELSGDKIDGLAVTLAVDDTLDGRGDFYVDAFHTDRTPSTPTVSNEPGGGCEEMSSVTPSLRNVPKLVSSDGTLFSLNESAETIGVRRDARRELPNVELPLTKDFEYCSQVQGKFCTDEDTSFLTYISYGRNSTFVYRNDQIFELKPNSSIAIEDGDGLSFGMCGTAALTVAIDG
ncbi:MAG: hypothetical protein IKG18_14195 [Atopobiaceae bacterium]|nr:hypothetical protein [Atopobiaceae bacterium]